MLVASVQMLYYYEKKKSHCRILNLKNDYCTQVQHFTKKLFFIQEGDLVHVSIQKDILTSMPVRYNTQVKAQGQPITHQPPR